MTDPRTMDSVDVQFKLDNYPANAELRVIFLKDNGEQRELRGILDHTSNSRKENVPVLTAEGWKSFNINRVLFLEYNKGN